MQYSKEEISHAVIVPVKVMDELQAIAEDHLKKCGFFYRIFSRVKTNSSLYRKLERKHYNEDEKIQDLLGMRINLYFQDDIRLCQDLFETCFELVEWAVSQEDTKTFAPTKINGVFKLPENLAEEIGKSTWELPIDQTFEIQIKTIFFEGWHEVEHDMRYKNHEIWNDYPSSARRLNSILATLELCDDSMVTTFEDLAHELYRANDIENMVRMHYRLKMEEAVMYEELEEILLAKEKTLAKQLFRCPRGILVQRLLKQRTPVPININTVISMVNEEYMHSAEIAQIMLKYNVYRDGKETVSKAKKKNTTLSALKETVIFHGKVMLVPKDGQDEVAVQNAFLEAAKLIYQWCYEKYESVFPSLPNTMQSINEKDDGFDLCFVLQEEEAYMTMKCAHLDFNLGGRIYRTESTLYVEDGKLWLWVKNCYKDQNAGQGRAFEFSYPKFYKDICESGMWELYDQGLLLHEGRLLSHEEGMQTLYELIDSTDRIYPVVCIVKDGKDGPSDEWIRLLVKYCWRFAHIYVCDRTLADALLESKNHEDTKSGIYLFAEKKGHRMGQFFDWELAQSCKYNWRLGQQSEGRRNNIVLGDAAFHHQMINEVQRALVKVE